MKFSLKWLGDFIEIKPFLEDPESLARALTQAGLEVESFEDQKADFKDLVIAELQSVEKHPQADRLTLCKVSTGSESYSIVCGAKNHKVGDKAVLAKPGAVLPGDFIIKKTRIRNVESEGMLASRTELGLDLENKDAGIWILPKEARVGQSLSAYLELEDVIFDVSVQPNRSDCLSHKGLAREISCLFSLPFLEKKLSLQTKSSLSVRKSLKLEVKDKRSCPRYSGRLIEGARVAESPDWLKNRLQSLGLKSINNIVDVTNFVLWDRGQPLHAFDRDQIQTLTVAPSTKGEKFLALDESELNLTGEELTIRDKDKVLALAGVIGGMDSGITEKTKNVFIEAAGFAPESIRRTSRRFGLETDSSYRFARGIDQNAVREAMDLACALIQKTAGGSVSEDFYDVYDQKISSPSINISLEDLETRLDYSVSASEFESWMKRMGCEVKTKNKDFEIIPPSYRQDLNIKEDLIEEFARLQGYDKVPEKAPPVVPLPKESDSHFVHSQNLKNFLSAKGWQESIHYSFCDPNYYKEFLKGKFFLEELDKINKESHKNIFSVNNPISRQLSLMKPLLAPDVIKNVVNNFRHNNKFGQIFELSPVFYKSGEDYRQESHLALALWGHPIDIWNNQKASNIYSLKSVLEVLFETFRIKGCSWRESNGVIPFLHPKQSLVLNFQNKMIGFLGSLHPQLLQKYKTPLDMALAEICWDPLSQAVQKPLRFKSFSNLLTVEKDLCFVIPPPLPVEKVQREIKKSLGPICEKTDIFDIYEKQGDRSVSFRMYLTPEKKPWTDEELQSLLDKVIDHIYKTFDISLK